MENRIIHFEKKIKRGKYIARVKASLTRGQADELLAGHIEVMNIPDNPLLMEIYERMRIRLLRPKVIVDYVREPYVCKNGNVRVTFDKDLRSGLHRKDLCERTLPAVKPLDEGLTRQSASKYVICRKLIMNNLWEDQYQSMNTNTAPTASDTTSFSDNLKNSFLNNFTANIDISQKLIPMSMAFLIGMTMVTALVIIAVNSNLILSLGMVGALSIVRFRTPIKDPTDLIFLFWSAAAGIVTGAGFYSLVLFSASLAISVVQNQHFLLEFLIRAVHYEEIRRLEGRPLHEDEQYQSDHH